MSLSKKQSARHGDPGCPGMGFEKVSSVLSQEPRQSGSSASTRPSPSLSIVSPHSYTWDKHMAMAEQPPELDEDAPGPPPVDEAAPEPPFEAAPPAPVGVPAPPPPALLADASTVEVCAPALDDPPEMAVSTSRPQAYAPS